MSTAYTESWLTGPLSTQFYTRTYRPPGGTPPKAVLVALHGFTDHCARYTKPHTKLAEKGLLVFTFDQRGWGLTVFDKAKKSSHSSYACTGGWDQQMADISWVLEYVKNEYAKEELPLFLMGHSMGGGEVLGFATEEPGLPEKSYLAGVIAASPCLTLTHPPNPLLRWAGGKLSLLLPNFLFPAEVDPKNISRDPEVVNSVKHDHMVINKGSLLTLRDMLDKGEELLNLRHARWPKSLPLFIFHGTADQVTSEKSSRQFFEKVVADKKKFHPYEGGFHEIFNEIDGLADDYVLQVVKFIEEQSSKPTAPETA